MTQKNVDHKYILNEIRIGYYFYIFAHNVFRLINFPNTGINAYTLNDPEVKLSETGKTINYGDVLTYDNKTNSVS